MRSDTAAVARGGGRRTLDAATWAAGAPYR